MVLTLVNMFITIILQIVLIDIVILKKYGQKVVALFNFVNGVLIYFGVIFKFVGFQRFWVNNETILTNFIVGALVVVCFSYFYNKIGKLEN